MRNFENSEQMSKASLEQMDKIGTKLKKKNKVVEAVGIEPTSECIVQIASTCLGHYSVSLERHE